MERSAVQAHQEYITQAEEDHRQAKATIRNLRKRGLLSEADTAQREYLLIMGLGFMSMSGRGVEYCEHHSTLRPPVLKKDCPA